MGTDITKYCVELRRLRANNTKLDRVMLQDSLRALHYDDLDKLARQINPVTVPEIYAICFPDEQSCR
jgi:hypothetical protein